jgi:hypothetical protein
MGMGGANPQPGSVKQSGIRGCERAGDENQKAQTGGHVFCPSHYFLPRYRGDMFSYRSWPVKNKP